MRFSFFKNDKSTALDELILFAFIVDCLGVGIALVATAPSFWIIGSAMTKTFGVLWILTVIMFISGLIYCLLTNEIKK